MGKIRTVLGDIPADSFGLALVHEHIIADFIGPEKFSKDRYDPDEVFDVMLPYLEEIRLVGVKGFVDCTPAFMARDPELLAKLSQASDIHVLTNAGLYTERYLPKYVSEYSIDHLADIFTDEIERGIDKTNIKAGFIKIAVNPGPIIPILEKVVRAAARCSLSTGASIVCHTLHGVPAMQLLNIVSDEGLNLEQLVVAHIDHEDDVKYHLKIAQQRAWVEYENLREERAERILSLMKLMVKNGHEDRVLLSQDSGWYHVGEKGGGKIRGYGYLVKDFVPMMLKNGFTQKLIDKVLIENPACAFQME